MKKQTAYGLLIDYEYCSGCHTCEVACQKEHGFDPNTFGIILHQLGPVEYAEKQWQYDNIPIPTDFCDHCASRVEAGGIPTCVKHCQSACMKFGTVEELSTELDYTHKVLFTVS